MANKMATMQGCCCGGPVGSPCQPRTPGVGTISCTSTAVRYDLPPPLTSANDPRERSTGWSVACNMLFESTHAGDFYLVWRKAITPIDSATPNGVTYYMTRDVNQVFSAAELRIFRRPNVFSAFAEVFAGSGAAALINQALGVANIHAATMIISPANRVAAYDFPALPDDSDFITLAGYDVPGSGVTWTNKPQEMAGLWFNQSPNEVAAAATNYHAGYTLLASGVGPYDELIYSLGYVPNPGGATAPGLEFDNLRQTQCHPSQLNLNHGVVNVAIGGIAFSGMPSAAAFTAAGIGWKRGAYVNICNDLNANYAAVNSYNGMSFRGASDDWSLTLAPYGFVYGGYSNALLQTSTVRQPLGFELRWQPRQPLAMSNTLFLSLRTPASYFASEAIGLVAGCDLITYTINGNLFEAIRVLDAKAALASLVAIATQKILGEQTIGTAVGNVRLELDAATVAFS